MKRPYKKTSEERIYERLNLAIKVNYEVTNRPHDIKGAISKDIGGGGICLSLHEKLSPGTKLSVKIDIARDPETHRTVLIPSERKDLTPEHYELVGNVVWTRVIEVSGKDLPLAYYDTGIQFSETDPVVLGKIVAYFHGREL